MPVGPRFHSGALVLLSVLALSGCDRFVDKRDLDMTLAMVNARIGVLEAAQANLQKHVAELPPPPAAQASWVLWRRVQDHCANCLWAPARPVSAYSSRAECVIAASRLIQPGGQVVTNDPMEIAYGAERRVHFHCLPPGTDASK